jgi:parallel beta-helix repeat protein
MEYHRGSTMESPNHKRTGIYKFISVSVVFLLVFSALILGFNMISNSASSTPHNGSTTSDEFWDVAGNPHVINGNFTVEMGHALTLEPGVVVQFVESTHIRVKGNMIAEGSQLDPITFTSIYGAPKPEELWDSIIIEASSNGSIIDRAQVDNANYGITCNGSNPIITNSTFSLCWFAGIYTVGGDPLIYNNTISSNKGWGIWITEYSEPEIYQNIITSNEYDGIYIDSNSRPMISGNTISTNLFNGIKCMGRSRGTLDSNMISNNENDGIHVNSASPIIINNDINGNLFTGIRTSSIESAPQISGNNISGHQKNGIVCIFRAHPTITDNNIFGNGLDTGDLFPAIYIDNSGPTISTNHIFQNNAHGIYMLGNARPKTIQNTIENNYLGIFIDESSPTISGDIISSNTHDGIYMQSSNPTITGVFVSSNGDDGIQVVSSTTVLEEVTISSNTDNGVQSSSSTFSILNSTFTSPVTNDIELADSSHISAYNTQLDDTKITFSDSLSTFTRGWYLTVLVTDVKGDRISDAHVNITDISSNQIFNDMALGGSINWIPTIEYVKDQSSTIIHTPHNVTAQKDEHLAYSDPDPYMNMNIEIIITFGLDLSISTPSGLNVSTVPEGNALNITWDPVIDAELTGYILYISYDNVTFDIEAALPPGNNSYIDENLTNGERYYYRISATNATNESRISEVRDGMPIDLIPPNIPQNLTVERGVSEDSLVLTWDLGSDPDIIGYNIYRSTSYDGVYEPVAKVGIVSQFTDTGLDIFTTYFYKITASDEIPNESNFTDIVSNTTWDTEAPKPPENLVISIITEGNALNLTWTKVEDEDVSYYTVYISTDNISYDIEAYINASASLHYFDENLTDGVQYYYRVTASDTRPNESPFSFTAFATPSDTITPSAPTGLVTIQDSNTETLDLVWNPSPEPDVAGYNVYRGLLSGGPYNLIATLGPQTQYKDTNLVNGTMYYYVVQAFDEVPNFSSYSNEVNDTTFDTNAPGIPGNLTVLSLPFGNTLNISWDAVLDLDLADYVLYRSLNNISFDLLAIIPKGTEFYVDTNLTDGATYYYRLSARDEAPNESPQTDVVLGIPGDIVPPSQPTGIMVTNGPTTDSLQLNWNANPEPDLAGYNVNRANVSGGPYELVAILGIQTEYVDPGLESDKNYYYVIAAFDEVPNNSSLSMEQGLATLDYDPPSTPANLTVVPMVQGNALNISWDLSPEPDVLTYTLYFSLDNSTFFIKAVVSSSTSKYIHTDLADGRTYYYMILASDEVPNHSPLSLVAEGVPSDSLSPAEPELVDVKNVPNKEGSLNISWALVINNTDGSTCNDLGIYSIYSNKTGVWLKVAEVPLDTTYFIDSSGLSDGVDYYYLVTASDEVPNESPNSTVAFNFSLDEMPPATPTGLDVRGTVSSGELNISWDPVVLNLDGTPCMDLVNYSLYRNGSSPGTWVFVANISAGTEYFMDTGLANGIVYNYTIQASDEVPNTSPISQSDAGIPWDLTPPSTPTGLAISDVANAEGMLNITWDPNMEFDFSHYLIYSNRSSVWEEIGLVFTGQEYFVDEGLLDGQMYYYNISAVDFSGNEAPQSSPVGNVSIDDMSPSVPSGLVVENIDLIDGSVNISWEAVVLNLDGTPCVDLADYYLYSNKTGSWQLVDIILPSTEYYIDSNLVDGVTYYYRIAAHDEIPNISPNSSDAFGVPMDNLAPSTPTGLQITVLPQGNALQISWNPNPESDVISYTLFFSTNNITFNVEIVILAGTESYLDTSLLDGTTYYYRIMATDEVPNDSILSSSVWGIPKDSQAPAAPSNLSSSQGPDILSVELSWDANSEDDLAGYRIYRGTSPTGPFVLLTDVGLVTKYIDPGLMGDSTYYYIIEAFDEVPNYSSLSNKTSISTPDTIAPSAPNGLTVVPIDSGNALNISWQANSEPDLEYYSIYRGSDDQSFLWIADVPTGIEYYLDTGLINGISYYYVLSASDEVPNQSPLSPSAMGIPNDIIAPSTPFDLKVIPGSISDEMLLYWVGSSSPDVAGYNIYRSEVPGGPYEIVGTTGPETSFIDSGLTVDVTYYYVVTAFDEVPNESPSSDEASNTTIDTIPPSIPDGLVIEVLPEGNSLRLTWSPVSDPDIENYLLYRSIDNTTFLFIASIEKGTEFYVDTDLEDGTTYYYLIKSQDEVPNISNISEIVSGIPMDSVSPATPKNVEASLGLVPNSVKLTWNANPEDDIKGYTVYYARFPGLQYRWYSTIGLETTYYVFNLDDDTTYFFAIDAYDEVPNNSSLSNPATYTTMDRTAPMSPENLTAQAQDGGGAVLLTWDPNTDADLDHYAVYMGTDDSTFIWIVDVPAGINEYRRTGLADNQKYFFVVAAFDEVPNKSPMSNVAHATPTSDPPPLPPTGLSVVALEDIVGLNISWDPNSETDLSHYVLYRRSDNLSFSPIVNLSSDTIYYVDEDVIAGQTYHYRLTAVDLNQGESELSEAASGIPQELEVEPPAKDEEDDHTLVYALIIIIVLVMILFLYLWRRKGEEEPSLKEEDQEIDEDILEEEEEDEGVGDDISDADKEGEGLGEGHSEQGDLEEKGSLDKEDEIKEEKEVADEDHEGGQDEFGEELAQENESNEEEKVGETNDEEGIQLMRMKMENHRKTNEIMT